MAELKVKIDFDYDKFLEYIDEFKRNNPDFIEVVRCAECKWSRVKTRAESALYCEEVRICTNAEATDSGYNPVFESHYCSYGERKESLRDKVQSISAIIAHNY